jgi:hypothetical protein
MPTHQFQDNLYYSVKKMEFEVLISLIKLEIFSKYGKI